MVGESVIQIGLGDNFTPSSVAFNFRDSNEASIVAKGVKISDSTNLVAEVVVREGLNYCLDNELSHINLGTDFMGMIHILNGKWEISWSVPISIHWIRNVISVRVIHFLRKENTLVDFFANLDFIFTGTYLFNSLMKIPSTSKTMINLDKNNTHYIRILKETQHWFKIIDSRKIMRVFLSINRRQMDL